MSARCALAAILVLALCPGAARAERTSTFWYTGFEQAYVVPPGYGFVHVRAIGGAGGAATPRVPIPPPVAPGEYNLTPLAGGRGAIVDGDIAVTPGQVLYVVVGNSGGLPDGGFNGGGDGGSRQGQILWGGGGASDLRTLPSNQGTASLESRLIVAAGGGGSAGMAAAGGDAGKPGNCCGAQGMGPSSAQPGTDAAGGAGGCAGAPEGCGQSGGFGVGGTGGASGDSAVPWTLFVGAGGGGGWFGGGGGIGYARNVGGGAGGSSKTPREGTVGLADRGTPPRVSITPFTPPAIGCADGADNDADGLADHPADPGCASAADEDEWNPDTFAPKAELKAAPAQRLARAVQVQVSCLAKDEDCIVSATGTVKVAGSARSYPLKRVEGTVVRRGRKLMLRVGLPAGTRAATANALRRRTEVKAAITVRVSDEIGNVTRLRRTVRLR
jgi:hypothetical protein